MTATAVISRTIVSRTRGSLISVAPMDWTGKK